MTDVAGDILGCDTQVNINNNSWENAFVFTLFRMSGIMGGVLCAFMAQVSAGHLSSLTLCRSHLIWLHDVLCGMIAAQQPHSSQRTPWHADLRAS